MPAPAPRDNPPFPQRLRRGLADFWLRQFFRLAENAPQLLLDAEPNLVAGTFYCSRSIRDGTLANARRILPEAHPDDHEALARDVVRSFYLFCCDVGWSLGATREQLLRRIDSIEGHDNYVRTRSNRKGVIVVTAHMGSFEMGMAALSQIETHIHVAFRRDAVGQFERRRSELRHRLGVAEAALDDGWTVWLRLRDALLANQAVVLQGDRVPPGQRGQRVPFCNGHIELPLGPVKLARVTGSPIVPVFTHRTPQGKIRLIVEQAIDPQSHPDPLQALATVLEHHVRAHPDQWLCLKPAWCEDQPREHKGREEQKEIQR